MPDIFPKPIDTLKAQAPAALAALTSNQNSNYRFAAAIAILALPFVNSVLAKVGLSVSQEQVITVEVALFGYIGQSVANAIHARSVAAAQLNAATPAAAVADLNRGANP